MLNVARKGPTRLSSVKLLEAGKGHLDGGNPLLASHALGDAVAAMKMEDNTAEDVAVETFRQLLRADVLIMSTFGDQSRLPFGEGGTTTTTNSEAVMRSLQLHVQAVNDISACRAVDLLEWGHQYTKRLCQLRMQHTASNISGGVRELLMDIFRECAALARVDDTVCGQFALISMGSLGRNEACRFSDVELVLVCQRDSAALTCAAQLFHQRIIALGESGELLKGLHLDTGLSRLVPLPLDRFLASIDDAQDRLLSVSMVFTGCILSEPPTFYPLVRAKLDDILMEQRHRDVLGAWCLSSLSLPEEEDDLKAAILRPITYGVIGLSLLYGVKTALQGRDESVIAAALVALGENAVIPVCFARALRAVFLDAWKERDRQHSLSGFQCDNDAEGYFAKRHQWAVRTLIPYWKITLRDLDDQGLSFPRLAFFTAWSGTVAAAASGGGGGDGGHTHSHKLAVTYGLPLACVQDIELAAGSVPLRVSVQEASLEWAVWSLGVMVFGDHVSEPQVWFRAPGPNDALLCHRVPAAAVSSPFSSLSPHDDEGSLQLFESWARCACLVLVLGPQSVTLRQEGNMYRLHSFAGALWNDFEDDARAHEFSLSVYSDHPLWMDRPLPASLVNRLLQFDERKTLRIWAQALQAFHADVDPPFSDPITHRKALIRSKGRMDCMCGQMRKSEELTMRELLERVAPCAARALESDAAHRLAVLGSTKRASSKLYPLSICDASSLILQLVDETVDEVLQDLASGSLELLQQVQSDQTRQAILSNMPWSQEEADSKSQKRIFDAILASLSGLYEGLSLCDCPVLDSARLSRLMKLGLALLSLKICRCANLRAFPNVPMNSLTSLEIEKCPLGDDFILEGMHALRKLALHSCTGLRHIKLRLRRLQIILLHDLTVLESLALRTPGLRELSFMHCLQLRSVLLLESCRLKEVALHDCPRLDDISRATLYCIAQHGSQVGDPLLQARSKVDLSVLPVYHTIASKLALVFCAAEICPGMRVVGAGSDLYVFRPGETSKVLRPSSVVSLPLIEGAVYAVLPLGNGMLVSCSRDGTMRYWDVFDVRLSASHRLSSEYAVMAFLVPLRGRPGFFLGGCRNGPVLLFSLYDALSPLDVWMPPKAASSLQLSGLISLGGSMVVAVVNGVLYVLKVEEKHIVECWQSAKALFQKKADVPTLLAPLNQGRVCCKEEGYGPWVCCDSDDNKDGENSNDEECCDSFVVSVDRSLRVWNIKHEAGKNIELIVEEDPLRRVLPWSPTAMCALSPHVIALGGGDGTIITYNLDRGSVLHSCKHHKDEVSSLTVVMTGSTPQLLSTSFDGSVGVLSWTRI